MTVTEDPVERAFNAAERLAPAPEQRGEATAEVWLLHYAALAFAAHVAFHDSLPPIGSKPEPGSRPELGYLMLIATSATAAVAALADTGADVGRTIFDLTPELGALNNEPYEYLSEVLDSRGVNPADIDHRLNATHFASASRAADVPT